MRSSWYWPQAHNDVVQKLLRKGRKGSRVVYIPGNHDEFLRGYYGTHFGGIEVVENTIHELPTADVSGGARRHLRLSSRTRAGWRSWATRPTNSRSPPIAASTDSAACGSPYWSLSEYLKHKVKNAVNFISAFEKVMHRSQAHRVDGVVCGHIHTPRCATIIGVLYCNCGDWVESCTAVVEHRDGRFEIVD